MSLKKDIPSTSFTADHEYALDPDYEYAFTLSGSGTWQVWDGAAWLDYDDSTGTTQAFRAFPPPSGRVNLNVTTPPGPVIGRFRAIRPEGRTRQGN